MASVPIAPACARDRMFTDTEGRMFRASCDRRGDRCDLASSAAFGPAPAGADPAEARFVLTHDGRVRAACEEWRGRGGDPVREPRSCRALVCRTDDDCPPIQGAAAGTCARGLCTDPGRDVGVEDAVVLCLAGTGAPAGSPAQVERFALGTACGTPCRVPTPCRQP